MSMPMPMPTPPMPNMPPEPPSTMSCYMSMQMSFFWGKDVVILFDSWPGNNLGMYILALIVVFLLAAISEVMSMSSSLKPRSLHPVVGAFIHSVVYSVRMGLVYLVMLSVMSFNGGVFIVAVIGHAVGGFLVKYRALEELDRPGSQYP